MAIGTGRISHGKSSLLKSQLLHFVAFVASAFVQPEQGK